MKSLLILGAGGFGQMVKETAIQLGYEEIVFLDDAAFGKDVVGKCCDYTAKYGEYKMAVAAFGNNHTRLFWTDKLLEAGYEVPSIVHPSAIVSPSAVLGPWMFYYAARGSEYAHPCGSGGACQQRSSCGS